MRIGFRVDASPVVGLGHFYRCLSIANALKSQDHSISVITNSMPLSARTILAKAGIQVEEVNLPLTQNLSSTNLSKLDAEITKANVNRLGIELLIVDHYGAKEDWLQIFENRNFVLMGICDYPTNAIFDFVLDYGFDASLEKHTISNLERENRNWMPRLQKQT